MTIQEFINKYRWQSVSNDYWAQCVLLVKTFSKEVLWINLWYFWWSAINGWYNKSDTFKSNLWDKIPNTPEWVPELWSIIFFKWQWFSQQYGHVAVVSEADVNRVTVIEQNGWAGTWSWLWDDAIRTHTYSYSWVVGWMSPKEKSLVPDFYEEIEEYSMDNIVVLYKWKYYINKNNKRVEVNRSNFENIINL